jgi:hypothetical protein
VPAPLFAPGAFSKLPMAAIVAGLLALGLGTTPAGSPKPPVLIAGTTTLAGGAAIRGMGGVFMRTVSGFCSRSFGRDISSFGGRGVGILMRGGGGGTWLGKTNSVFT